MFILLKIVYIYIPFILLFLFLIIQFNVLYILTEKYIMLLNDHQK